MNKRRIGIGAALLLLILILGSIGIFRAMGLSFSTGRVLRTRGGACLFLLDGTPVELTGKDSFGNLQTGDRILLLHGPVRETYPGSTDVHFWKRLSGGSPGDIPGKAIDSLTEMGWLEKAEPEEVPETTAPDSAASDVRCAHGFANMALTLPEGWACEVREYREDEASFGIDFWPEEYPQGRLRLEFYPDKFGVCGTGLREERLILENGLEAIRGTYQGSQMWSFLCFSNLPGSYVVTQENADIWWDAYGAGAMEILGNAVLAEGILPEADAIEIAGKASQMDYDTASAEFDACEGIWSVTLTGKETQTVRVHADGTPEGEVSEDTSLDAKPVIYLYPEKEQEVTVKLNYSGTLTAAYPACSDGCWHVTARPDGTLTDPDTGREYYCLFWEGVSDTEYDFSSGFVVPGEETAEFLEDALEKLGLTDREAEEFIIYWLPRMKENPYNLISFQQSAYTDSAKLEITPEPDTCIRVFMAWKPLSAPVELPAQTLAAPERRGFTAVEWGGAKVP